VSVSRVDAFRLRGARVELGSSVVFDGLDFEMPTDIFTALLGANGSGKTTLMRALLTVLPLRAGTLEILGKPASDFDGWRRVGYVPQRFEVAAGVPANVREVVRSGRAGMGRQRDRKTLDDRAVGRALELVDLSGHMKTRVDSLSGGQKQRVLIARALAREPEVLVLDEPVASVDPEHQRSFAEVLRDLRERGCSILLSAHSLGPLAPLVDQVSVLDRGRIVYEGKPPREEAHDHAHHPAGQVPEGLERTLGRLV
jgi:zinc transport system ATP-binding protein